MNKKLIQDNMEAFKHWLNKGDVLACPVKSKLKGYAIDWQPIDEYAKWDNIDTHYIINDEYVEFRKALAEGKTIQLYDVIELHISNPSLDKFGWRDFKSFTQSVTFSKSVGSYRIKPDEPKFKVGDFVTPLNRDINCSVWKIDKVLSCNTLASGIILLDPRTIQPWTPVKGEWCWFYDSKSSKSAALAQFKEISNDYFMSITDTYWKCCEPFLNSIPSYLKDK